MKVEQLKHLIREIITEAVTELSGMYESQNDDPSKEEMVQYLWQAYGRLHGSSQKEFEGDAEEAIYWFANDFHGGQSSNLYSVLSTSAYRPGPISRGPEKGSMAEDLYHALVQKWGHEKQMQEDGGAVGASGGVSVGNTTAAVQGYNTPNAFGKKRKKYQEDSVSPQPRDDIDRIPGGNPRSSKKDKPKDTTNVSNSSLKPSPFHHGDTHQGIKKANLNPKEKEEFRYALELSISQFQAETNEVERTKIMSNIRILKGFLGL